MSIDIDHRGRGLASSLLAHAAAEASTVGLSLLHAEVHVDNEPSLALFASAGYTADGPPEGRFLALSRRLD